MNNDERLLVEAGWQLGSLYSTRWYHKSAPHGCLPEDALTHSITTVRLHELAHSDGRCFTCRRFTDGTWAVWPSTEHGGLTAETGDTYNEALRAAYTAYKIAVGEWEDE